MKSLTKINVSDWTLSKIQDNIESALDPVLKVALIDGLPIESVSLTTGVDNNVSHLLGRSLRFWIIAKKSAQADVWEVTSPAPQSILTLRSSANVTVSLWVA